MSAGSGTELAALLTKGRRRVSLNVVSLWKKKNLIFKQDCIKVITCAKAEKTLNLDIWI